MTSKFDIAALVDDLEPVTALNPRRPIADRLRRSWPRWSRSIIGVQGIRADVMAGQPDEMFLIRAGILLVLGGATAHAVTSMASPSVGKSNNGWQIALAAAVVFPLSAMIVAINRRDRPCGVGDAIGNEMHDV